MMALVPFVGAALLLALIAGYLVLAPELRLPAPPGGARASLGVLLRWSLLGSQAMLSAFVFALGPILAVFEDQRADRELGPLLQALGRGGAAALIAFLPLAGWTLVLAVRPLYSPLEDRRVVSPLLAAGLYGAAVLAVALQQARFLG